ncbi:hypothetical protein U9J35_08535 [Rossellomorea aquimaris]|nr:hypothetical protein [Rossellomorea aquimaris]WRP08186.1 hypothetical protein U9J35_08535 [Rossellomorea aquimaris]
MGFNGCLYCGHPSLTENELSFREEYGDGLAILPHGKNVGGNIGLYCCENCGYLHLFQKEKRKIFEREAIKKFQHIRWNIR